MTGRATVFSLKYSTDPSVPVVVGPAEDDAVDAVELAGDITTTRPMLLVGEAPNARVARRPELWLRPDTTGRPHTANRMRDLIGVQTTTFLRAFDRTNLLTDVQRRLLRPSTKRGGGDEFDVRAGRARAEEVKGVLCSWKLVVLLGRRVGAAFGLGRTRAEFFEICDVPTGRVGLTARVVVVPHPSGSNRWFNDPEHRTRFRRFFRRHLREHGIEPDGRST